MEFMAPTNGILFWRSNDFEKKRWENDFGASLVTGGFFTNP